MNAATERKVDVLFRLFEYDDRIIRQRPSECGTYPDSAWWLLQPQGGRCWIGTVKWLERHGMIAQSIAPTKSQEVRHNGESQDDLRKYYQSGLGHRVYAITAKGQRWMDEQLISSPAEPVERP